MLGHFSRAERELMAEGYEKAVSAIEAILDDGIEAAMNVYNRKAKPKPKEA